MPFRRTMSMLVLLGAMLAAAGTRAAPPVARLRLPPGFHVSVYTDQVPSAREMAIGARGTLFVGSMTAGAVYAVTDDGPGRGRRVRVVARGLTMPVGVAFRDGDLYISDVRDIVVLRGIEDRLDHPPAPQVAVPDLPWRVGDHGWKFIAFGPDSKLYVPIGAPCNICDVGHRFGRLMRMNPDGTGREDVAYGLRNSVGFTWQPGQPGQPGAGTLWFTDNGRDLMGDDVPSDELNRVDHAGQSFGYPYCHQGDVPDPVFGRGHPCSDFTPPVLKLGAHVAALGLRFYTGSQFPAAWRGALLIAEHGSWNRSRLAGYRVMAVRFGPDGGIASYVPLIDGFQQDETPWGRPADVQPLPDGSVLVSDDLAGAIYRVTYGRD
ncbi:putative L-sorbosone dehydrogenase [Gluconacetobacter diazotrophicus PA1 5]|uniref:PQQ-dependent sugar dehydrogenase n=1 Tax=Gluconacetobacter diazotrophicus TaxID=33996 RepID=UPI000173CDC0|nr:PQQ-dependent sugar dehydrogenase [Gluconacetobacter diazotrophicus]ACI51205.1 putative L-sorbosone dehydrogenase [Gluconacetobacter diazotrophicus PA1 5]TWB09761.1 glucose/arabinose dehydrogenase [Gluconacetobacter diazotrophicus]